MSKRVSIHICNKSRSSELGLLLQSLRTQTFQDFDVLILDDASGTPVTDFYYIQYLLRQLRFEGHGVQLLRNQVSYGVCQARNFLLENDTYGNEQVVRLDDDVILEPNYIQQLIEASKKYDITSGITPMLGQPEIKRRTSNVKPIINEIKIGEQGDIIKIGDDCGASFVEQEIIPSHQARSCFLFPYKLFKEGIRFELGLGTVGFREEGFFTTRAILAGYTVAVNTGAKAWHMHTPSGGVRSQDYAQQVSFGDAAFRKWLKQKHSEKPNFLKEYNIKVTQ